MVEIHRGWRHDHTQIFPKCGYTENGNMSENPVDNEFEFWMLAIFVSATTIYLHVVDDI